MNKCDSWKPLKKLSSFRLVLCMVGGWVGLSEMEGWLLAWFLSIYVVVVVLITPREIFPIHCMPCIVCNWLPIIPCKGEIGLK